MLASKVPLVTFMFWIIKICATTVGETGGDALSMTFQLGYAVSSLIFFGFFLICLIAQVSAKRYYAFFYWLLVIGTTTVGTTMSDRCHASAMALRYRADSVRKNNLTER